MAQNALIAAIEEAIAQAKETSSKDEVSQSEALSTCLVKELNKLSKPSDPTKLLSPLEFWLRATVANLALDQSDIERLRTFYELLAPAHASEEVAGAIGFLLCWRSTDVAQLADDEQRRTVLHRLARVHELGLAEYGAAGLLGSAFQSDERCIADRFNDAFVDGHVWKLPVIASPSV
jgi:hypothetical protein